MVKSFPLARSGKNGNQAREKLAADLEKRITGSKITTADEPGREKRPGPDAPRPTCRRFLLPVFDTTPPGLGGHARPDLAVRSERLTGPGCAKTHLQKKEQKSREEKAFCFGLCQSGKQGGELHLS